MLISLSGRILLPDLGFSMLLSRTMGFNLTAKPSGGIIISLSLEIDTQPQPIRKEMGRLKQLIRL